RLDFDQTVERLTIEDVGLMRKVNVVSTAETRDLIPCYCLGHDSLGLVLHNWKRRSELEQQRREDALKLLNQEERHKTELEQQRREDALKLLNQEERHKTELVQALRALSEADEHPSTVPQYVCNSWQEIAAAQGAGAYPFDVVVVGAGMYGAYCAEKL